jgi:hypothetical protein
MKREPSWLPVLLSFGPILMALGISQGFVRAAGGDYWVGLGFTVLGVLMISRGLVRLLEMAQRQTDEIERLRQQLNALSTGSKTPEAV